MFVLEFGAIAEILRLPDEADYCTGYQVVMHSGARMMQTKERILGKDLATPWRCMSSQKAPVLAMEGPGQYPNEQSPSKNFGMAQIT